MKEISLIKKAQELGLCKISKHPITGDRVITPPEDNDCLDLTDKWEELQGYANSRRRPTLKIKFSANDFED